MYVWYEPYQKTCKGQISGELVVYEIQMTTRASFDMNLTKTVLGDIFF